MSIIKSDPEPFEFQLERSALIVVDMQNAYASKGGYLDLAGFDLSGAPAVIDNVQAAIDIARANSMLIVYFKNGWDGSYVRAGGALSPNQRKSNALKFMRRNPEYFGKLLAKGSWDYELVDRLKPLESEIVIEKSRYSGFVSTDFDSILRSRDIRTLFFVGVALNVCVESTIRDAFGHEYNPIVIKDCTMAVGPAGIAEASLYNIAKFYGWVSSLGDFTRSLGGQ
jgi:ureidoacrylate peracid hydrolase